MAMANEYQYIEIEGTKKDWIERMNQEGEKCWIPIWQKMEEPLISHGTYSCYFYRKYSTTNQSRQEQKIICNEERINNYPQFSSSFY